MHRARTRYVAGMPQLSYTGLSENWLLKTCGDLHWQGLAALAGQPVPEFRDAGGHKSYAAFLAIRVREAALETMGEHAAFAIDTGLQRVTGARHHSTHRVMAGDARRAEVSMMSTFIRRERERDNRSVVRAAFGPAAEAPLAQATEMASLAKRFRAADWGAHLGLAQDTAPARHTAEYLPCPYTDFNGADLLYFASFQAIVDRAEWQWQRFDEPPAVSQRDLFFHGNVNLGDALELSFSAVQSGPAGLAHWCEIRRASDGEKIADAVTRKRWRTR
ncbi:Pnap_2097 family protein [Cupriavidus sp. 2TAF22]|uniref:Pnap_2097 family protein n=1 Tax=unclassified Cupriavidus TaxID=2640874 RepID=UPI003F910CA1